MAAGNEDDHELGRLARRSPNFAILAEHDPLIASLAASAESYVFSDPNTSIIKARQFGEALAKDLVTKLGLPVHGNRAVDRERALAGVPDIGEPVIAVFCELREQGNAAVHEFYAERRQALHAVERCFDLAYWYFRALTGDRQVRRFMPPTVPEQPSPESEQDSQEREQLNAELAQHRDRLLEARSELESEQLAREKVEAQLARAAREQQVLQEVADQLSDVIDRMAAERDAAKPAQVSAGERQEFLRRARRAAEPPLTEQQVRERLDEQLRLAGWSVQDSGGRDLVNHLGVAVRELHTSHGYADYLLYVGKKLVGVIEAKREGEDLSAAQQQAANYANGLTKSQQLAAWRPALPFQYVTDGNEVRFRNMLDPDPRTRRIFAVHQPQTVARWMQQAEQEPEAPTLRAKLAQLPQLGLDKESLREAQFRAIRGLDESLAANNQRALIQMATGAGKTFTAASSTYRLLRHGGVRKVLFLVDRNNLGDQAKDEFRNFKVPDGGRQFSELYNCQKLAGDVVPESLDVTVCTIQRLWLSLTGQRNPDGSDEQAEDEVDSQVGDLPVQVGYNPDIPPELFDLIIVDECHRSIYGKWRAVLEYFDSFLVGLTATPIPITFGFFEQNLVSEYSYDESVADGVNVQFEVYRIDTRIGQQGSTIDKGTVVPIRNTKTRRERYEDLDEDHIYTGGQEGRSTLSKDRLRTVIQEFKDKLFTDIFPPVGGKERTEVPKTLIFAKSDEHAEEVVETVRGVFGRGDVFCQKITAKAHRAKDRLQEFRNSPGLRIAVTVDMIATGTDVRPLECVFFLREPKTWYLFEQMKGRGARTVKDTELKLVTPDVESKTHFVIVDAVGVTDSPRLETKPLQRFTERQISLEKLLKKSGAGELSEDEFSTLASRLTALRNQLTEQERNELSGISGEPIDDVVSALGRAAGPDQRTEAFHAAAKDAVRDMAEDSPGYEQEYERAGERALQEMTDAALQPLAGNPELRTRLLEIRRAHDMVIDEVSRDEVTVSRGLTAEERAQQQVSSFRQYMREHQDEIAPLEVAFRERRNLHEVYGKLKDLATRMQRTQPRWTPQNLLDAYDELGKVSSRPSATAGVPELVGIIRHELGLDDEVRPYAEIVQERYAAWLQRHQQHSGEFTEEQLWWLGQIRDTVCRNVTVEVTDLRHNPFAERGGTRGFRAVFGPNAREILDELNQELSA